MKRFYYVYYYVDPRNGKIFYIGKGSGNRCFEHLAVSPDDVREKSITISEIRGDQLEPEIYIPVHGLESEKLAFLVEMAVIDLIDKKILPILSAVMEVMALEKWSAKNVELLHGQPLVEITEP